MKAKISFFFLLFLLLGGMLESCGDDFSEKRFVEDAVSLMDTYGLFATGVYWEKAKAEALASDPKTIAEAKIVVDKALKVAGGKHSFLMTASQSSGGGSIVHMPTITHKDNDILVIKLPSFSGNSSQAFQYAQTSLNGIPAHLRGVVIDLRGNTGGNMYPMLAAVHCFLPDDKIVYFRRRDGMSPVSLSASLEGLGVDKRDYIPCRVAILTDGRTLSAAEMVLLSFRGLDNVRTFGDKTGAYTSVNRTFELPQNTFMILTTSTVVTRTGEEFCNNPVTPDVNTSAPLELALQWLNEQ